MRIMRILCFPAYVPWGCARNVDNKIKRMIRMAPSGRCRKDADGCYGRPLPYRSPGKAPLAVNDCIGTSFRRPPLP
jgi:hypothetical protein